jgi:hypothetical protein
MADPSETTQVSLGPAEPEAAELLDAIRSMSGQIGSLQNELQGLRTQARGGLPPAEGRELPGWDDRTQAQRQSSPWIRSLDGPGPRTPAVPRLLLEVLFLVVVAVAAALAQLDAALIVVLMAGAWALVAAAEWVAAREARRRAELSLNPLAGGAVLADDPSWFAPPVERVPLEPVPEEDTDPGTSRSPTVKPS